METEDPNEMPSAEGVTAAQARAWLESVRGELLAINEKLKPLREQRDRLAAREQLLERLVQSFDNSTALAPAPVSTPNVIQPPPGSVGDYVVESAVALLREAGKPLHINDLHAKFVERGLFVPGAGTAANLTAHLKRGGRVVSPERGIYMLASDGAAYTRPTRRRRRRRARRRTRSL